MELITLIPGLLVLYTVYRYGTSFALERVVLPVLLLLPTYFYWNMRPLPALNFIDVALLALGVCILAKDMHRWQFTRMDLWVALFIFTYSYPDYLAGRTTDAFADLFVSGITGVVPYMAAKICIEQAGARVRIVKSIVILLSLTTFASVFEYVLKRNPYTWFWSHFYPGQWPHWFTQIRWGFGRVAGPFGQSELAGMIILTGLLLALWVGRKTYHGVERRGAHRAPFKWGKFYIALILIELFSTQARGPWIGAIVGVAIASIGRAKRPLRAAVIVVTLLVGVGVPAYKFAKSYTSGPRWDYGSERETAQYRAQLLDNYIPIAQRGGVWGWGHLFPRMKGQISIDNQFLYAWVVQGKIGLLAMCLMIGDTILVLIIKAIKAQTEYERHFILTILASVIGVSVTATTVFLGEQSFELLFLLLGWAQGIQMQRGKIEITRSSLNSYPEPISIQAYS